MRSLKEIPREEIKGREPKHVTYVKAQDGSAHDMLVIKEYVHLKDGTRIPRLNFKKDYKRSFWVTYEGRQNHNEKKDYEYLENLKEYKTTQVELPRAIAQVTKDFKNSYSLKKLARNPYLYGIDVTTSCLVKAEYRDRYGRLISRNSLAGSDIETNVHSDRREIIMQSLTFGSRCILVYLKSWLGDIENPIEQTHAVAEEYIGEFLRARGIAPDFEVVLVDTPGEIVRTIAERAHEWMPDFVGFWNIDFDMTNMLQTLVEEEINPAEVFSDPSIPSEYQYFSYVRGNSQKETASGKTTSINIEDRWNWVTHPASFQFIDLMPIYRILRLTGGKEPNYRLDSILAKNVDGLTKLKFEETAHLTGLRWHQVMQKDHKIKYGVYNIFDSITLELLDEKTGDISSKISTTSGNSDYKNFNSNPKRLCDAMHFWYLKSDPNNPRVIGSSSDQAKDDLDEYVVGHEDWITG